MLRHLSIRDFVIVDRLELEFAAGFGALTGETGAGKSILLDALGLALGGKAEAGVVRTGQARAEIVAEFDLPADGPLRAWLADQQLDAEEGSVMLRRVIESGGRSKAWLNGSPVVLAQLRIVDLLAAIEFRIRPGDLKRVAQGRAEALLLVVELAIPAPPCRFDGRADPVGIGHGLVQRNRRRGVGGGGVREGAGKGGH